MRSCRIEGNANQNVDPDEEASSAKECLQKVHFSPHPLVDARDLGRPRFPRSSRGVESVLPRHTPATTARVAPLLALLAPQTCHDASHHSCRVAISRDDTPECNQLSRCRSGWRLEGPGPHPTPVTRKTAYQVLVPGRGPVHVPECDVT